MALEVKLEVFEGPLDLILFLLGKNKLEIQDISISLRVRWICFYI